MNRRRRAVATPPAGASKRVPAPAANPPAAKVDSLIHERTRLGIVGALAATESLSFTELRNILKTTDGNISAHTRKLEDAGYVVSHKRFEGRVPRTDYRLTASGRRALETYLDDMEALIRMVRRPGPGS